MDPGAVRQNRRDTRTFLVGLSAVAVLGFVGFLVATAGGGFPLSPRTTVTAAFTDIDSLQTGDEVRENSRRVGQVGEITFRDDQAIVVLQLDGDREVHADATAAVWDFSALGAKFVEFRPGDPGAGPLGAHTISGTAATPSSDIYDVLNVFDPETRDNAQQLLQELGGGVAGGGEDLNGFLERSPDLLADLGQVSAAAASSEADLPDLLREAEELTGRFAGRQEEISQLIDRTGTTFAALGVDGTQPLRDTVDRLPGTLDAANAAFDALDQPLADTDAAMSELRPGAAALARSEEDLRAFLRDSPVPLDRVPGVADAAEPAVEDLEATFADLRPLAPPLVQALTDLATPLAVLAPYAPDAGQLFVRGDSFVAEGTALPGVHYARLTVAPGAQSITDGVARSPLLKPRNAYPAPGEADQDRADLDTERAVLGEDR